MSLHQDFKKNLDEKGSPQNETRFYEVDTVVIKSEVQGQNIKTGEYKTGPNIFSDSFAPCQAVIAKFKDGQFAIYHAFVPGEGPKNYEEFINKLLAQNLEFIYVIEKSQSKANSKKGPILADDLRDKFGSQVAVKQLRVENYTCVVADNETNSVILAKEVKYIPQDQKIEFSGNTITLIDLGSADPERDSDWEADQADQAEPETVEDSSDSEASQNEQKASTLERWSSGSEGGSPSPTSQKFFSCKPTELNSTNPEKKGPQRNFNQ